MSRSAICRFAMESCPVVSTLVSSHTVIQQQKARLAAATAVSLTGSRFSACIACSMSTSLLVIGL